MARTGKPVVWLHGQVKSPPLSAAARVELGWLLRQLQEGALLALPRARPMPSVGRRCHELRVNDQDATWRLVCRLDADAVIVLEVFSKKTEKTPLHVIAACQRRLRAYDDAVRRKP